MCLLAWEDIEAGAELADEIAAEYRSGVARLNAMLQGSVPRDIND